MKMQYVIVEGMRVPVCKECMGGSHMSYGSNHLDYDTEDRGGCKNLSDDGQTQCNCHGSWKELQDEIVRIKE